MRLTHFFQAIVLMMLTTCSGGHHAESVVESTFSIEVTRQNDDIVLNCKKGCNWDTISMQANNWTPLAINESGVTTDVGDKDDGPSKINTDFLFEIIKTDKSLQLKGLKGMQWLELSFSLFENEKKVFDANGVN